MSTSLPRLAHPPPRRSRRAAQCGGYSVPVTEANPGGRVDPETVPIPLRLLDPELGVPSYAHAYDAGADLRARTQVTLAPGERAVVPTGVAVAIPPGFVALVHPRSGLAAKTGVTVLNAPGTIDSAYRGEVGVILHNTDPLESVTVHRGDRIAQLVLQRVVTASWEVVSELSETERGAGGFGSTGGITATREGQ